MKKVSTRLQKTLVSTEEKQYNRRDRAYLSKVTCWKWNGYIIY